MIAEKQNKLTGRISGLLKRNFTDFLSDAKIKLLIRKKQIISREFILNKRVTQSKYGRKHRFKSFAEQFVFFLFFVR